MKVIALATLILLGVSSLQIGAAHPKKIDTQPLMADHQEGASWAPQEEHYDQLPKWNFWAKIYRVAQMPAATMYRKQLEQANEILAVASTVKAAQAAIKRQKPDERECLAIQAPSMKFLCTCRDHKPQFSSFKR